MNFDTLLCELKDGIFVVTLNRPDVLNAVNMQMRADFTALSEQLFFDDDIKVVIFTGAGKGFSSGGDISHFEKDWSTPVFRAHSRRLTRFFDDLEALEKPVIAAVNGPATGAGLELALACDIRIASEEATLGFRENYISLIPGVGGCVRLVRHIGLGRAKELIFTGNMIDAGEAEQLGLVNRVTSPGEMMDTALELAGKLRRRAPLSIGVAKRVLNLVADMDHYSGQLVEGLGQSILLKTEDHQEGISAFRQKRKPDFKGK